MSAITNEELLAEIERLDRAGQEGVTVTELVEQTRRSRQVILQRLKAAAKAGRLVVGRKPVRSIDGRPLWAPCYTLVAAKREATPKKNKRPRRT